MKDTFVAGFHHGENEIRGGGVPDDSAAELVPPAKALSASVMLTALAAAATTEPRRSIYDFTFTTAILYVARGARQQYG